MTAIINKTKKRVAIYCRVSTDEQAETGTSLASQEEKILDFINYKNRDYSINKDKHIYIDRGESGAKDDRPALNKMFRDAEEGEFDVVMVYKVDRLFRKTLYLLQYVEGLYEFGVGFKSITQDFDTSTSYGKFMLGMLGVIGELERDTIRERTVLGKMTRAKEGFYVGGGGVKFGYDVAEVDGRKVLTVNKEESKIVNEIFRLYGKEGKSLQEIADLMTSKNIQTKYDKLYKGNEKNRKKTSCHWYSSNISNIIKDEMYIGKYYYGKTYTKMDKKTLKITTHYRKKGDPLLVELSCPIVLEDINLFYKCRELVKQNLLTKNNKKCHHFTGFISCGKCGRNYRGYRTSKKTLSYKCGGAVTGKTPVDCRCNNPQVSEKILISEIWKKIILLFNDTDGILENYYKRDNKENNIFLGYQNELNKVNLESERLTAGLAKSFEDMYTETDDELIKIKKKVIVGFQSKIKILESRKKELVKKIDGISKIVENKKNVKRVILKLKGKMDNSFTEEQKVEFIKILLHKIVVGENGDFKIILKFFTNEEDIKSNNNSNSIKKNYYKKADFALNKGESNVVKKFYATLKPTIGNKAKNLLWK